MVKKRPLTPEEARKFPGQYGGCYMCILEGRKFTQYPIEELKSSEHDPRLRQFFLCKEHYEKFKRGEFSL